MDDLIADFVAECRDMLEALGGEIVAWEAQPGDRARLDNIFRFVHTVKGNCGFFDFPRLEALSHAAEDALADVRANRRHADPALVSSVLAIIDRISEMVSAIEAGEADGAAYTLVAPFSRWKDVVQGELDPIKGMMQGKLRVHGDLPTIVRYVKAANELVRLTGRVDTSFQDEA